MQCWKINLPGEEIDTLFCNNQTLFWYDMVNFCVHKNLLFHDYLLSQCVKLISNNVSLYHTKAAGGQFGGGGDKGDGGSICGGGFSDGGGGSGSRGLGGRGWWWWWWW